MVDKAKLECSILNKMRPSTIIKVENDWKIDGIHFETTLKDHANTTNTWTYKEDNGSISFECSGMRWDNGSVIVNSANDSVCIADIESNPVNVIYPNILGNGVDIKIIQDNYRFQKLVEIKTLTDLGEIPVDAEYLEIPFKISSDFELPDGAFTTSIKFGKDSFLQSVKVWDSSPQINEEEIKENVALGEIKDGVIIKKIPVSWLKKAVFPIFTDTTITYGAENVFNSASTDYISVAALDSTHFVASYRDGGNSYYGTTVVGVISGTTITSYGTENVFNSASTNHVSVAALDSTHFVVCYKDDGGDDYGIARVGIVSGTTITSYGAENVFNSASTVYVSAAALDSTHFVVVYRDGGNSDYGTGIIGVVSGTTITSYGAENVFSSIFTTHISVAALDSTHFVVAYKKDGTNNYGAARVGIVSGTTITSYGAENVFNSADTYNISAAALDSTHFVVSYQDGGNSYYGTARVGIVSGTTITSYGSENVFNSATTYYTSVAALDSTHFVVAYRDAGNSNYGTAIVGVVSGTTITSYGSENVFNSAATLYISVSDLDSTHFVVTYMDDGGDDYGIAIAGSIPTAGWVGTFNGIPSTSIAKINGIALADIAKINGVASA